MLENPPPPWLKFSFPTTNFSMEGSSHVPSPFNFSSPPKSKIPLKTPIHFPITIATCKYWSQFVTCSPSRGDSSGVSRPKDIIIRFLTMVNKNAFSEFWFGDFGERMRVGGGLGSLQYIWSLKKGTRTFNSR